MLFKKQGKVPSSGADSSAQQKCCTFKPPLSIFLGKKNDNLFVDSHSTFVDTAFVIHVELLSFSILSTHMGRDAELYTNCTGSCLR